MNTQMKKQIAFLFVLMISFAFVACGDKNAEITEDVNREIISINDLIDDLDNLARAEQNVGKATHLFGTVDSIGTETFTLNHFFIDKNFSVPMDKAALVELNKGDYIAIYAVVDKIDGGNFKFKNCKAVGMELMDAYVVNMVSTTPAPILFNYNGTIRDYVSYRGDTFILTNNEEVASYVLGKWDCATHEEWHDFEPLLISSVEFCTNGDLYWRGKYKDSNSGGTIHYSWSVVGPGWINYDKQNDTVYKLTENIMILDNYLHVRK